MKQTKKLVAKRQKNPKTLYLKLTRTFWYFLYFWKHSRLHVTIYSNILSYYVFYYAKENGKLPSACFCSPDCVASRLFLRFCRSVALHVWHVLLLRLLLPVTAERKESHQSTQRPIQHGLFAHWQRRRFHGASAMSQCLLSLCGFGTIALYGN